MIARETTDRIMAACHCGAVSVTVATAPREVTVCNCSLCSSTGAVWAYYLADQVATLPDPSLTDTYAWNGKHVDFHRCRNCGCITHWLPRDRTRAKRGVNARLMHPEVLAAATVRHRDGGGTGRFLEDLLHRRVPNFGLRK